MGQCKTANARTPRSCSAARIWYSPATTPLWEGNMKLPRRSFLHLAAGAAASPAASRMARAQTYPTRPITLNVPFAAGGPTDVVTRILAERMRVSLGQTLVVENVGGADGTIGVGRAVRAAPDGYTVSI